MNARCPNGSYCLELTLCWLNVASCQPYIIFDKSCRLAPIICLLAVRVKLNQLIHIILSARELMKLGDMLSSGELPQHRLLLLAWRKSKLTTYPKSSNDSKSSMLAQRRISPICCFLPLVEDYDDLLLVGYASNKLPFASIDWGEPSWNLSALVLQFI
jgi:hypothetical protein